MRKIFTLLAFILPASFAMADMYIIGPAATKSWDVAEQMRQVRSGSNTDMYVWVGELTSGLQFKFRNQEDSWEGENAYYNFGFNGIVTINGRTDMVYSYGTPDFNNCIVNLPDGKTSGKYIVFVHATSQRNAYLYVMDANPENLYIVGDGVEANLVRKPMNKQSEGVFTYPTSFRNCGDTGNYSFKFTLSDTDWYPAYGTVFDDYKIHDGSVSTNIDLKPMVNDNEDHRFMTESGKPTPDRVYNVIVDLNGPYFRFEPYISTFPEKNATISGAEISTLMYMRVKLPDEIKSLNGDNITISCSTGGSWKVGSYCQIDSDDPTTVIFGFPNEQRWPPYTNVTYTVSFGEDAVAYKDVTFDDITMTTRKNALFDYSFTVGDLASGIDGVKAAPAIRYNNRELTATGNIVVYNMQGVQVYRGDKNVDLSRAPKGIYIARCGSEVLKFVVR